MQKNANEVALTDSVWDDWVPSREILHAPITRVELAALRAVTDAARAVIQKGMQMPPCNIGGELLSLADALDAYDVLDAEEPVATLYVDGGKWGSERSDGE